MASLKVEDKDVMILRAGYIYRQRTFFKKWKRTWLVVCLGGSVRYYRNRNASRPQKSFDVKNDCIAIKAGKQCVSNQTVLMRTRGRGRGRGGRGRGRIVSVAPETETTNTQETNEQTQNSDTEQPANTNKEKRKRSKLLEIPQEKQDEVADWYRENEPLYNKAHYQYKDTALKNTRWQAKANELGVEDWKTLRTWVESMISQLGRLTREGNKSGSGRKDDTQRDKWIKEKISFLGPHIARIETRGGINCKTMLPPKDIDTGCLMEIVMTGDRTLKLCAADPDQSRMWHHAFKRAQSDKQLPTPRHERRNLRPEEIEELEEKSCWYCCCRKNKIEMLRNITSR